MRRALSWALAAATITVAHTASAQPTEPGVVSGGNVLIDNQNAQPVTDAPPLSLLPTKEDNLMDPRMARSWGAAPPRWFLASTVDVGFIYGRPRATFGYGKPFTAWFGIEANPIFQSSGLGLYGGMRLELPHFDIRVGPRYFSAFTHTYLPDQPSYDRLALESTGGTKANVVTYEAELDASIPAGPGNILVRGSVSYLTGVPEGMSVFEETLHMIVKPPLVWRTRLGYAYRFGTYRQHQIGLVADILDVPHRDDSKTMRVGPLVRFVLSRRVELRAIFVVTAVSPDRIGLVGGDFAELGVRYRWATE